MEEKGNQLVDLVLNERQDFAFRILGYYRQFYSQRFFRNNGFEWRQLYAFQITNRLWNEKMNINLILKKDVENRRHWSEFKLEPKSAAESSWPYWVTSTDGQHWKEVEEVTVTSDMPLLWQKLTQKDGECPGHTFLAAANIVDPFEKWGYLIEEWNRADAFAVKVTAALIHLPIEIATCSSVLFVKQQSKFFDKLKIYMSITAEEQERKCHIANASYVPSS